jgi:biopolymer transport protein ExbD
MHIARKRMEPVKETQMVSLADIAFLIIFFFMLTATFMKDRTTVPLPVLPKGTQTASQITVTLDSQARIFVDDDQLPTPADLESTLRNRLAGKTDPKDCEVRFKCDKMLKYKTYRPIYEAIANAGGVISIIHEIK